MLEKTYNYSDIEPRISEAWEEAQAFRAGRALRKNPKAKAVLDRDPAAERDGLAAYGPRA